MPPALCMQEGSPHIVLWLMDLLRLSLQVLRLTVVRFGGVAPLPLVGLFRLLVQCAVASKGTPRVFAQALHAVGAAVRSLGLALLPELPEAVPPLLAVAEESVRGVEALGTRRQGKSVGAGEEGEGEEEDMEEGEEGGDEGPQHLEGERVQAAESAVQCASELLASPLGPFLTPYIPSFLTLLCAFSSGTFLVYQRSSAARAAATRLQQLIVADFEVSSDAVASLPAHGDGQAWPSFSSTLPCGP